MSAGPQPAGPCVLVIFGVAGDLTRRLLMPALYHLRRARLLPEAFAIVGVARAEKDEETFREDLGASLRQAEGTGFMQDDWQWLRSASTISAATSATRLPMANWRWCCRRLTKIIKPTATICS